MAVAICDDDPLWVEKEKQILAEYASENLFKINIVTFSSREELLAYNEPVDAVLMDIELGDDSGILAAQAVNGKWEKCQVIFVTNHLFYATDVYNTEHAFFVLKDQFQDKIGDVFQKVMHNWKQHAERLVFSVIGKSDIVINPYEVMYFERDKRITNIVTRTCSYKVWDKLDDIAKRLSPMDFVRCHNSYIVYLPAVREVQKNAFILNNGEKIVISRSRAKRVKELFLKWSVTQMS